MATVSHRLDGDTLTIGLAGRVDSACAKEVEDEAMQAMGSCSFATLVLDCQDLEYVSSAGLRVILRMRKSVNDMKIINVSSAVYEVFDMTGFTEMFDITKAYRVISVDGCEAIGHGANGVVWRIDADTVVKEYRNPDSLPEIHRERELARTAFVLGIPTAIPYDVVRVGEGYGSVFELLDATSYASLLASGQRSVEEIARMSVELLLQIHETVVRPGSMPDMRELALDWYGELAAKLDDATGKRLMALIEEVPEDLHMMHGDYHINNVMVQNGESLLIDMDTLCHGHPIFELGFMYNAYVGFGFFDPHAVEDFLGISYQTARELWDRMLVLYLEGRHKDPADAPSVERKAALVGIARLLRRAIRVFGPESAEVSAYRTRLDELLDEVDTLLF